ncbi:hypothetical protein CDD83_9253 [Cordyceps sp. RAO-2017]|nr:hypothetical protein CDD83_9253 [Cordyceps sp. RAO-2017]
MGVHRLAGRAASRDGGPAAGRKKKTTKRPQSLTRDLAPLSLTSRRSRRLSRLLSPASSSFSLPPPPLCAASCWRPLPAPQSSVGASELTRATALASPGRILGRQKRQHRPPPPASALPVLLSCSAAPRRRPALHRSSTTPAASLVSLQLVPSRSFAASQERPVESQASTRTRTRQPHLTSSSSSASSHRNVIPSFGPPRPPPPKPPSLLFPCSHSLLLVSFSCL